MKKILIISDEEQENLINLIGSEALRIKSHSENIFEDFAIDVFSQNSKRNHKQDNINFLNVNKNFVFDNINFYEAVLLFQNSHFSSFTYEFSKKNLRIKTIVDLYNPLILEKLTYSNDLRMSEAVEVVKKIISFGDYYICANLNQKKYYMGFLSVLEKIQRGNQDAQNISTIPTILKSLIKKKDKENRSLDFVFFGGFYPWFDKKATDNFTKKILESGKSVTFIGSKNPAVKGEFLRIAGSVGSVGDLKKFKNIFFIDWVSYEKISSEIAKYKVAVNLVKNTVEDGFAYRTRLLSLLQNGIPVITNGNDEISRLIVEKNAGSEYVQEKAVGDYLINLEEKSRNALLLFSCLNKIDNSEKNKILEFLKNQHHYEKKGIRISDFYKKTIFFIRQYFI